MCVYMYVYVVWYVYEDWVCACGVYLCVLSVVCAVCVTVYVCVM